MHIVVTFGGTVVTNSNLSRRARARAASAGRHAAQSTATAAAAPTGTPQLVTGDRTALARRLRRMAEELEQLQLEVAEVEAFVTDASAPVEHATDLPAPAAAPRPGAGWTPTPAPQPWGHARSA